MNLIDHLTTFTIVDALKTNKCFHCETEELALDFLIKARAINFIFFKEIERTCWGDYEGKTCYASHFPKDIVYADTDFFIKRNYTVIRWRKHLTLKER